MSNLNDRLNDIFRNEAYEPMNDDALVQAVMSRAGRKRTRFNGLFALAVLAIASVAVFAARLSPPDSDPAAPSPTPTLDDPNLLSDVTFDYEGSLAQLSSAFVPPRCGETFTPESASAAGLTLAWAGGPDAGVPGQDFVTLHTRVENESAEPVTALVHSGGVIVVRDGRVVQTDSMIPHLRVATVPGGGVGDPQDALVGVPEFCDGEQLVAGEYQVYAWAAISVGPEAGAARALLESGLAGLDELGAAGGIGTYQSSVPDALVDYCTFSYLDPAAGPEDYAMLESAEAPDWNTFEHPELGYLQDVSCDVPDDALAEFLRVAVPTNYINEPAAFVLISEPLTILRD